MRVIKHKVGRCNNGIKIHPIADIHIGSKECDIEAFKEQLWEIKQDYNSYIILNGDLINNAIKQSVSNIYDEKLTVQQSIDLVVELLEPVKHKILGVVSGNHENRTYKEVGIDVTRVVCDRLGITDRYDPISNYIVISFSEEDEYITFNNSFTIYHTHGTGGGKTTGAKANRLAGLSQVVQADVYIHSHTHSPITFKENFILGDYRGVFETERLYINTNSYQAYGGYGEVLGLIPSNRSPIVLYADVLKGKKRLEVTIK